MAAALSGGVFDAHTGPIALFVACLLSGVLIPMPEDVALVVAGTNISELGWFTAIGAASLGVFLRDGLFFGIGHFVGESLLEWPWVVRILGAERIQQARAVVASRGAGAILIGRLSIGVRTSMFLVAGALGVRPRQFVFWDAVGLAVTVPLWLLGGHLFGGPAVDAIVYASQHVGWLIAGLVLVAATGWLVQRTLLPDEAPTA